MNWFTWQQHKKQFLIFGILLAAFAALAIPTGLHFWHTYQNALATCGATDTCSDLDQLLFVNNWENKLMLFMKAALVAVPFLLGIFWGVPLVAREYSESTNLLVWTRSVSRRKWLTVKLVWILAATAVVTGAFAALSTWWWRTGNALYLDRFSPLNFGIQGVVPIAIAVFAVALGIAFGAWFKRILPAIALTFGVLAVVQIAIPMVARPHYAKTAEHTAAMAVGRVEDPGKAPAEANAGAVWTISSDLYSKNGEKLNWDNPPEKCSYTQAQLEAIRSKPQSDREPGSFMGRDGGKIVSLGCLSSEGYKWHTKYHPSYRYWNFQRIEVGLYLGLSLIPLAATYWLVLKRDA
jgi:ABC-type transport system involved in multi-copper enzyme maturation permease subunit